MTRIRTREAGMLSSPVPTGFKSFNLQYPYTAAGPWYDFAMQYFPASSKLPTYEMEQRTLDELHEGPPWKEGGPFNSWRILTDWPSYIGEGIYYSPDFRYRYSGSFSLMNDPRDWLDFRDIASAEAAEWGDGSSRGPEAWARFAPGKPQASLGQFIGEFREMPLMLKTTAKGFQKLWKFLNRKKSGVKSSDLGDQWLNAQFGWAPFLRDLQDFLDLGQNYEKHVKQLQRDNGQWKKRRGTVFKDTSSEVCYDADGIFHSPAMYTACYDGPSPHGGKLRVTKTTSTHAWFSARMKYYIPNIKGDTLSSKLKLFTHLYGLNPSPALVWELTPWSWLVDWAGNIGDNLANVEAIAGQGVTAKYAYLMTETVQDVICTAGFNSASGGRVESSNFARLHRKQREAASPFGFGFEMPDFTAFQLSILAALGMSRTRRLSI